MEYPGSDKTGLTEDQWYDYQTAMAYGMDSQEAYWDAVSNE